MLSMIRWALSLPLKLIFALLKLIAAPKISRARNAEDAAAIVRSLSYLSDDSICKISRI